MRLAERFAKCAFLGCIMSFYIVRFSENNWDSGEEVGGGGVREGWGGVGWGE